MGVITGKAVDGGGITAVSVPAVGVSVESVTALRALEGSADLPTVVLTQLDGAAPFVGGGLYQWSTTAAVDDGWSALNLGGEGTSGSGWRRLSQTSSRPVSVRVVETANVNFAEVLPTVYDTVTVAAGDLVGLVGQDDATENGVYVVADLGGGLISLTRDASLPVGAVATGGIAMTATAGTANIGITYRTDGLSVSTVDTDALNFTREALPSGTGSAAHTDGSATVVASMTLPASPEGYYAVRASAAGGSSALLNKFALSVTGCVYVDGGAAGVGESVPTTSASGYTAAITCSGLVVSISVTAANGIVSTGHIEALSLVAETLTAA